MEKKKEVIISSFSKNKTYTYTLTYEIKKEELN